MLVVDDHAGTRNALRGLFRRQGYCLREAGTVAEGLASLDPAPHCIILDLMLPDGGGEEILRKVREAALPTWVIVCTGTPDTGRLAGLNHWRPDALFYKPIDIRDFFSVCEVVRRQA